MLGIHHHFKLESPYLEEIGNFVTCIELFLQGTNATSAVVEHPSISHEQACFSGIATHLPQLPLLNYLHVAPEHSLGYMARGFQLGCRYMYSTCAVCEALVPDASHTWANESWPCEIEMHDRPNTVCAATDLLRCSGLLLETF